MSFGYIRTALVGVALLASTASQAADWKPSGPIRMMIGFAAGGGADTLGRLLAEEIDARIGWNVIPENVVGKGGAAMLVQLKDEPADGLSIGVTVSEALAYSSQAARDPGYGLDDFTYLSTLTGTQTGIVAKPMRGWKNLGDMIAAAKSGKKVTIGAMTQKLADATYVLARNNGVDLTVVMTAGGKGGMDAVIADDVDAAWAAGVQINNVKSGDLTNLASAEAGPLKMQPDAPQIQDFKLPYDFGVKFMVVAPKELPEDARTALQAAIADILNDPSSKLSAFAAKAFSGPEAIQGPALEAYMRESYEQAADLIKASSN